MVMRPCVVACLGAEKAKSRGFGSRLGEQIKELHLCHLRGSAHMIKVVRVVLKFVVLAWHR